jgi:drug/metabolite transporter (DMT)-like permease
MGVTNMLLLAALAAIWGSSFLFMRYLSPLLGPVVTADMRVLIAGLALAAFFAAIRFKPQWRRNWRHFLVIGMVNSGVPFLLYSFAALHLPASVESILNAFSPVFGALFSAVWLGERITLRKASGMVLGVGGVALVSSFGGFPHGPMTYPAVAACLLAAACYGLAGIYIKKRAFDVKPMAVAGGSQLTAGVILFPLVFLFPPPAAVTVSTSVLVAAFALLCSAVAYLIYYKLMAETGPTRALAVTFLIPVFGMLWGALFLGERITPAIVGGAALILGGTFAIAAPCVLRRKPPAHASV